MKSFRFVSLCFIVIFGVAAWCIAQSSDDIQTAKSVFQTLRKISDQDNGALWGKPLYGPTMIVNPQDRSVIASEADANGQLKDSAGVFVGRLPESMNIANTALEWSGKRWTMLFFPIAEDEKERNSIIAHESFHRIQPEVGIALSTPDNNHLDDTEGRVLLRLECAALKAAINAQGSGARTALTNAIVFRRQRWAVYPGADSTETALERTEGLAQFTGLALSGRTREEKVQYLNQSLDNFPKSESFVRSFAYVTGDAYGFLLSEQDSTWPCKLHPTDDLSRTAERVFRLPLPNNLKNAADANAKVYQGDKIRAEENERARVRALRTERLKQKFGDRAALSLPNINMNIQFDPRTLVPVEGLGTLYAPLRATAVWGVLEADSGAVVAPDWSKIVTSKPLSMDANSATGEGWRLKLAEGFYISASVDSTEYQIRHIK